LDGRQTLDYIFKIAEADTTNADYQFGRGVYDYFASIIPERYPQVKLLMSFFPNADRKRGLRNLNFTADQGHFIRTEAVYFLLQIHLFYEPNFMEARRRVRWLRNSYPDNAYFHVLEGRLYARWSQWERAITVYREVVRLHDAGQRGYGDLLATQALYNIGRYEMGNERHDAALRAFERVGSLSADFPVDTYFSVNAVLRTGMIYDLQGRREEARALYRRVLDMDDEEGSRDEAREYLRNAYAG
jgi:tetratricopeptide (TPR) repeat protein